MVAAIDFGTTYSGYAFSWSSDWRKVHIEENNSGNFMSSKTPTTLLLNPNKSFCAFGYGAENIFIEMTEDSKNSDSDSDSDSDSQEEIKKNMKENKNWKEYYYFQRFKMMLLEDDVSFIKIDKLYGNYRETVKQKRHLHHSKINMPISFKPDTNHR